MTVAGPYVPAAVPGAPAVEILYRRPPGRERRYAQELLHDGDDLKVSLAVVRGTEPLTVAGRELPRGSSLLWFTFPGKPWEVASVYDPRGRLIGYYTNLVRPPELSGRRWEIEDRFLDVWQEPGGAARVLDEEELEEALRNGWIDAGEAEEARAASRQVVARAEQGAWPPRIVRHWSAESIPYLRIRRTQPGRYRAALLSGRLIGFGLYVLGATSLTALLLGALRGIGVDLGPRGWLIVLGLEALVLLPPSLRGMLPATRWPRPLLSDERTLLVGALAAGAAVVLLQDADRWRGPLIGLSAALALFSGIFAFCRIRYDRRFPTYAAGGLTLAAALLWALRG